MKYLLSVIALAVLSTSTMQAQNFLATATPQLPEAPVQQPFLTIENKVNLSILAGFVAADAITTQRGLNQGLREMNPVMRPFVTRGAAGEAAGSALGYGAAVGVVYLLHRTHHYKAERITMRLMVAGEGGFVANNIIAIR
jgi:hypothetical protein